MHETEKQFLEKVAEAAQYLGWRVAHWRPAWTTKGYRTPVQFDGKGFFDLILVRGDRLIMAEVKAERGNLTLEQLDWHNLLKETKAEVYIFKPSQWQEIEAILR